MRKVTSSLSVITFNVNVLNSPIKKQTGRMDFFKELQLCACENLFQRHSDRGKQRGRERGRKGEKRRREVGGGREGEKKFPSSGSLP